MAESFMILVTGAPATGKTTLSKSLSERLNLPVVYKDEIKELLFDSLGIKDTEWAMKLGVTSFELTYLFAEKLAKTGKSFIVEGNFDNRYATDTFHNIVLRYNYRILQLYCHAQDDILYERFMERNISGERHPGHISPINGFEEYKKMIGNRNYKLEFKDSIDIDVDTTIFENINLELIYDRVERIINISN
jgi:predicted kinase